jgi:hypothetical protein
VTASPAEPENACLPIHTSEVRAWMDQNFDQKLARQRAQADTAKLVTTFSLAFAATILATALQVANTSKGLDLAATICLGLAFLLTLVVIMLNNVVEPDSAWLYSRLSRPMPIREVVDKLLELESLRDRMNEDSIFRAKIAVQLQLLATAASAVLSLASLFGVKV